MSAHWNAGRHRKHYQSKLSCLSVTLCLIFRLKEFFVKQQKEKEKSDMILDDYLTLKNITSQGKKKVDKVFCVFSICKVLY